jgi:hypothetical protein
MRHLRSFAILAGLIVGIAWVLLCQGDFGDTQLPAEHDGSAELPTGARGRGTAGSELSGDGGGEGDAAIHPLPAISHESVLAFGKFGEAFLRDRGESALNLLAVFTATQDRQFLQRALDRFPADPAVLYVAFFWPAEEGEDRTGLIERFKTVDPGNPVPYLFSAAELFAKGKSQNAVTALNAALDRPAFYTYFNERVKALSELALFAGADQFTAQRTAFLAQPMPEFDAGMGASRALQALIRQQRETVSGADLASQAQLLYGISRMLQTPEASRGFIGHLLGLTLEKEAVEVASELPANPLPFELQARLQKIAEMKQQAVDLSETVSRNGIHPKLRDEYIARSRRDGEVAARQWVVGQRR